MPACGSNTAPGSNPMRKPMPLRWIEEAEARRVLAAARWDAPALPFAPGALKAPWAERVRRWVAFRPASPSPESNPDATAVPAQEG